MPSKTVAYLILAHNQPGLLFQLVTLLDHPEVRIYIHLDRSADLDLFTDHYPWPESVNFIEERVKVWYGGYSMVEAELALIRAALTDSYSFRYLRLLSGVDFPLKPAHELVHFYQNSTVEYLSYFKVADRPDWHHKVRYPYFHEWPLLNKRNGRWGMRRFQLYNRILKYVLPRRRFCSSLDLYGGAQWWALTAACAQYVLTYLNQHPEIKQFFRLGDHPDEQVFQTVILNSPFASQVIHYGKRWPKGMEWQNYPVGYLLESNYVHTYVDWNPAREQPALLREGDLNELISSGCYFCRKLDARQSAGLIEKLLAHIRKN
ncbi:beta-1,6-N-acetylglucosaminyltransferase [Tellurirhabdus bombi]|uniref:beta-1,6-N-acetylglucosaminyltransferase n=1 Tax=Tellurirhabdus bombi TaxID=2907205 RepID=UPI001F1DA2C5|nr:beta-1,6-N-acetylglucosaminyltransferase [Tellurirhabdus bombi]